jgi:hypothetical protein
MTMKVFTISATLLMLSALPLRSDTSLGYWYKSLMRNDRGGSCCDTADCRAVDYRIGPMGYEAFVDGQWTAVPDETSCVDMTILPVALCCAETPFFTRCSASCQVLRCKT